MICRAVIPVKATEGGKSRLASVLDAAARDALVRAMLANVVDAANSSRSITETCLVGPSRRGLSEEIALLDDPGQGLNAAVQSALADMAGRSTDRVIIIAGDLPNVTTEDFDLLAAVPEDTIGIAPDRHGTGTNAISLPLPAGEGFSFAFGTDSFTRHKREASRTGLDVMVLRSPGLEQDIDEPADLPDARRLLREA